MSTEKIIQYVLNSPNNTNPNVLRGMLTTLQEGGPSVESSKVYYTENWSITGDERLFEAELVPQNLYIYDPSGGSGSPFTPGSGPDVSSRAVYYTEDWSNPEASTGLHQATLIANSYYKYDPDAGSGLLSPFIPEPPAGLTESGVYLYDKDEEYVTKIYDDLDIFGSIDLLYTSGSNSNLHLINLSDLEIGQSATYVPDQGGHNEIFTITRTA